MGRVGCSGWSVGLPSARAAGRSLTGPVPCSPGWGRGVLSCRSAACRRHRGPRASPGPSPVLSVQGSCDKSSVSARWLTDCSSPTGSVRSWQNAGAYLCWFQLLNAVKGDHETLFLHKRLLWLPLVLRNCK